MLLDYLELLAPQDNKVPKVLKDRQVQRDQQGNWEIRAHRGLLELQEPADGKDCKVSLVHPVSQVQTDQLVTPVQVEFKEAQALLVQPVRLDSRDYLVTLDLRDQLVRLANRDNLEIRDLLAVLVR